MKVPYTRTEIQLATSHDRTLRLIGQENRKDQITEERIDEVRQKALSIIKPMINENIYLGGGHAIAYILSTFQRDSYNLVPKNIQKMVGGFYRDHAALDLLCFEDDLPSIVETGKLYGLHLVGRLRTMFKVLPNTKFEGYSTLDAKEAIGRKNLRLAALSGEYANVYIHHLETATRERVRKREDGIYELEKGKKQVPPSFLEVVSTEGNIRVKVTDFEGIRSRIAPDVLIKCAHPFYLLKAKARAMLEKNRNDPRHELDVEILENILEHIQHSSNLADIAPWNS
ncbi:hypothetical protein FJZ18_03035 [Candidatus Pacearchaeota archaeon]|nr:hypothetical protein [Candidatus Pacearchaeota archaeon]